MRKSVFTGIAAVLFLTAGWVGCSGGSPVRTAPIVPPATITLSPSPTLSMEVGTNTSFTATLLNSANSTITEAVNYQSSNPAVVTVAANGQACAGSWDNLTAPQICTPGPTGVAQISATVAGVSSPATTVYVHQHIDSIVISPAPGQNPPTPPSCFSAPQADGITQTYNYQATALSRGIDITPTVGQFTWQAQSNSVVTLSNTVAGLANMVNGVSLNQVEATAKVPGISPIFATIGNAHSAPITYTTCLVQSIALAVTNQTATSETIAATVLDTQENTINNAAFSKLPLTWSSSEPASVSVSSAGVATGSTAPGGGASIIASCTPPTCNVGVYPTLPIYPTSVVPLFLTGTGVPANSTVYVSSTGCGTVDNCFTAVVPITVPANTLGTTISFPQTPDSFVFNRQGTKAYLGTDSGLLGSKGLAVLDPTANTVTTFPSSPGKVLTVSPDGTKVVISDTKDTPNLVYVFDTSSNTPTVLPITGATAADFSPDSLKAFIISGSTLYVYSKGDTLRSYTLTAPASDVAFLANGMVGYLSGNTGVAFRPTCDDPYSPTITSVGGATGGMIRALPDGVTLFTLAPPNVQTITTSFGGTAAATLVGCPDSTFGGPANGYVTVNNVPNSAINLGQGSFTPTQLLISETGSTAYIISQQLSSILVFNIGGLTTSAIPLRGNARPVQAALTPDATLLYVAASDGTVHVLNTVTSADIQQISFPQNFCLNSVGQPQNFPCAPNLITVRP